MNPIACNHSSIEPRTDVKMPKVAGPVNRNLQPSVILRRLTDAMREMLGTLLRARPVLRRNLPLTKRLRGTETRFLSEVDKRTLPPLKRGSALRPALNPALPVGLPKEILR